jgi:hypothetical protein
LELRPDAFSDRRTNLNNPADPVAIRIGKSKGVAFNIPIQVRIAGGVANRVAADEVAELGVVVPVAAVKKPGLGVTVVFP